MFKNDVCSVVQSNHSVPPILLQYADMSRMFDLND